MTKQYEYFVELIRKNWASDNIVEFVQYYGMMLVEYDTLIDHLRFYCKRQQDCYPKGKQMNCLV